MASTSNIHQNGKKEDEVAVVTPESLIKHPLQHSWGLWYFKNDRSRDWVLNLKLVSTVSTVEDFWSLYNHILPASKLLHGCDFSLFKDGIAPQWEDSANKNGGRWLMNLNKHQRQSDLDKFWLRTLLCLIGESFEEHSDSICGATVNIRNKGDKLAVWTADVTDSKANLNIGRRLKEELSVSPQTIIGFQSHDDNSSKSGSMAKNLYTV